MHVRRTNFHGYHAPGLLTLKLRMVNRTKDRQKQTINHQNTNELLQENSLWCHTEEQHC
jgi:hypothetical protein